MQNKSYVEFTEAMKKDYTILVPNMLPVHFKLIISVMKTYGYKMELLENTGNDLVEAGLKYTHNDTCYPAILVIGQFIDALQSGKYDLDKTALIMFQTGGGCRASNYISLIRKALKNAGMEQIPVISLSLAGLESHSGFKLTVKHLRSVMYGIMYGDLIMSLVNQVRPYETVSGDAEMLAESWTKKLGAELGSDGKIEYKHIKENCREIIRSFSEISVKPCEKPVKVGIVGEIFVKYSPLANNDLERFLISEGAEPIVPGLWDFCLYCVYNMIAEYGVYKKKNLVYFILKKFYTYLCKKKNDISELIKESRFRPYTPFENVTEIANDIISNSVKMGEGWLLTAEMLELAEMGCENIVCTQPFGCLPNHICGKGMMKPLKEKNPDINIVAIDYDAGASKVNQENRLKLMLFNARKNAEKSKETQKV